MELIKVQFRKLTDLKKIRKSFPARKVFILENDNILLGEFTQKEIEYLVIRFDVIIPSEGAIV